MSASAISTGAAEYSTQTLDSIISTWTDELVKEISEFETQAEKISAWDAQLRNNQQSLDDVMNMITQLIVNQEELGAACETIETYQSELDNDLISLSTALDNEINQMERGDSADDEVDNDKKATVFDNCDIEREQTFSLATQLEVQLNKMRTAIQGLDTEHEHILQSNKIISDSTPKDSKENPVPQIVEILTHHQDTLQHLEKKTKVLQQEIMKMKNDMRSL